LNTAPDGEVIVLDSAGYGPVSIAQHVSIIAPPGIYAGISVFPGTDGVTVNAPGATVVLRGLSINDQGGDNGISIDSAAKVQIESCVINGIATGVASGIRFLPSSESVLVVTDTTLRNNGKGIAANALAGGELSRVEIWRTIIEGSKFGGVSLVDMTRVSIGDTLVAENGDFGVLVSSSGLSTTNPSVAIDRSLLVRNGSGGLSVFGTGSVVTVVNVSDSVVANNQGPGVFAGVHGYIRLSGNHISGNLLSGAATAANGVVASMLNNLNAGNGAVSAVAATITPY
jgi:hypothetical protein